MAKIVDYQELPTGGYLAMDDQGQSIPTAYLPPQIKMGIDAQKQMGGPPPGAQLRPDIAAAAMAPQPDNRIAMNDYGTLPEQRIEGTAPTQTPGLLTRARDWFNEHARAADASVKAGEIEKYGPEGAAMRQDVKPSVNLGLTPSAMGGGTPGASAVGAANASQFVPPDQRVQIGGQGQKPLQFGGGGGMRIIPGGEVKAGEVMGSTSYDPEAQVNLKRAQQNEWEATQKGGAAQKVENEGTANIMGQIPEGLRALEQQRQDAEAIRQQNIAGDIDQLNQLRQESRQDIDPGHLWQNESNGSKFWGALMVGLGTLGAGMSGQPNVALGIMNKAMDADIDAQKENRNNKRAQFEDQKSIYKENLGRFQDERQAEVATKAAYLENAQAQLAALKAQAKTPEDEAKIDVLSAELQKESAKTDLEFTKITHQIHTKVVAPQVVGGGGPTMSPLDHEKYVPQFGGVAPTKDEAVLARAKGSSLNTVTQLVSENVRLRNNPQAFIPGTDAHAQLASNQAQLLLEIKRKENADLGVIAGPDMELMTGALGNGPRPTPGQTAAMQNFLANTKRMNENVRKNLGLIPVETSPYRDASTGEVKIGQRVIGNVITPGNTTGEVEGPIPTQKSYGGKGKGKKED